MSSHNLRGNTTKRENLRAQAFKMYGRFCNYCGDTANEVDHILELAEGGDNDISNLQVLCTNCHKIKTAAYNSKRKRNKGNGGVFFEDPAPRLLSILSLSPTLVSEPPMSNQRQS